jgi:hypothetical protein
MISERRSTPLNSTPAYPCRILRTSFVHPSYIHCFSSWSFVLSELSGFDFRVGHGGLGVGVRALHAVLLRKTRSPILPWTSWNRGPNSTIAIPYFFFYDRVYVLTSFSNRRGVTWPVLPGSTPCSSSVVPISLQCSSNLLQSPNPISLRSHRLLIERT